mmetsp:Transcript_21735/g.42238  ORF Transcript_21735/g.42238 Transcript_21735/m.42238 type:complete len:414 (+) Transcript_21735:1-1242(+)
MEKRAREAKKVLDELQQEIIQGTDDADQDHDDDEDDDEFADFSKGFVPSSSSSPRRPTSSLHFSLEDNNNSNNSNNHKPTNKKQRADTGGSEDNDEDEFKVFGKDEEDKKEGIIITEQQQEEDHHHAVEEEDNDEEEDDDEGEDDDEDDDEDESEEENGADEQDNPWVSSTARAVVDKSRSSNTNNSSKVVAVSMAESLTVDNSKGKQTGPQAANIHLGQQAEMVARAFAMGGDHDEDFEQEKKQQEQQEEGPSLSVGANSLPGWGSWSGEGIRKRNPLSKRSLKRQQREDLKKNKNKRQKSTTEDSKSSGTKPEVKHVIFNKKRNKKALKYTVPNVPFPYTSKQQYQMSMRQPLGRDWNTFTTFKEMTKPEVETEAGTIIEPITLKELKRHKSRQGASGKNKRKKHAGQRTQ